MNLYVYESETIGPDTLMVVAESPEIAKIKIDAFLATKPDAIFRMNEVDSPFVVLAEGEETADQIGYHLKVVEIGEVYTHQNQ